MWLLPRTIRIMAVAGLFLPAFASSQNQVKGIELSAGIHRIEAEVASSIDERTRGLMYRKAMPANHGMLFIFPEAGVQCFWMKNTLIPLSIAFLDEKGLIVNLAEMRPQSLDNHCSRKPVRFALEMNAGWFKQRGLAAGARIEGLDNPPSGQ